MGAGEKEYWRGKYEEAIIARQELGEIVKHVTQVQILQQQSMMAPVAQLASTNTSARKPINIYRRHERSAWRLTAELNVDMRLLFHGSPGIANLWLEAKFWTSGMTIPWILHHIDLNVAALKHAFHEIEERQRTLYFMCGM